MAFNPSDERYTQTFAFSLIPKNGMPIDRSTVVADEAELADFVERGWIVDGVKTFIKSKGKACTVRLLDDNGNFETVDEVDIEQVGTLVDTVVSEKAPSKAELTALSSELATVDAKVDSEVNSIKAVNTQLQEQLTTVKNVTDEYTAAKETFATKQEVAVQVGSVDLSPYATHEEVTKVEADAKKYVEQYSPTVAQYDTLDRKHTTLSSKVDTLTTNLQELADVVSDHRALAANKAVELQTQIANIVSAIEDINRKMLAQPSGFTGTLIIDGQECFKDVSIKYGKTITAYKTTWIEGSEQLPITKVLVKFNGETVSEINNPVKGQLYELTPRTVTADIQVSFEAVYQVATLQHQLLITKQNLTAPIINNVKITGLDKFGNDVVVTASGELPEGTVLQTCSVTFTAGDSDTYTIKVGDSTIRTVTNCIHGRVYEESGIQLNQTIGAVGTTTTVTVTVTDIKNDSQLVSPAIVTFALVSAEVVIPNSYVGYVEANARINSDLVYGSTFKSVALKGGDIRNVGPINANASVWDTTDYDYVVLVPKDYLRLTKVEYADGLSSGSNIDWIDCTNDFSDVTSEYGLSLNGATYSVFRTLKSQYNSSDYRITVSSLN